MTRAEYETKYGTPAPAASVPVKMTRAEYEAKYGAAPGAAAPAPQPSIPGANPFGAKTDPNFKLTPVGTAIRYGSAVTDAFHGGIDQANQGADETRAATNPVTKVEGLLKFGSGVASAATAPIAPLMKPLGAMIEKAGEGYGAQKPVQEFANSKVGLGTARVAEDLANAGNIAGTAAGFASGVKPLRTVVEKTKSVVTPKAKPASTEAVKAHPLVPKRYAELKKIEDSSAPVRRVIEKAKSQGIDTKQLLSETDLLHNAVDETGTIRTTVARQQLTDHLAPVESVVTDTLRREGVSIPLKEVEQAQLHAIDRSGLEGSALEAAYTKLETEMKGLSRRANTDGKIMLDKVHAAKVSKYNTVDYSNEGSKIADKAVARTYKELVEKHTKSADVQALNRELQQHYAMFDLLEELNGKKVEGGRLGKHVARILGGVIGSHFGPLGTILGSEALAKAKGASMASKFNGKTGKPLGNSQAMDRAIANSKQPPLGLPAPKPGAPKVKNNVPIPLRSVIQDEKGVPRGDYGKTTDQRYLPTAASAKPTTTSAPIKNAEATATTEKAKTASIHKSVAPQGKPATEPSTALGKVKKAFKTIKQEGQRGFVKNPLGSGPKIHIDDQRTMSDFTDYAHGSYKPGAKEAHELEIAASRIWERHFPTKKMPKDLKAMAGHFADALDAAHFGKGGSQSRGPDGRFR